MNSKIADALAKAQGKAQAAGNSAQPTVVTVPVQPEDFEKVAEKVLETVPGLIVNEGAITGSGVNPDGTLRCPMAFKNNGGATRGAQFWSSGKVVLTNIDPATLGL